MEDELANFAQVNAENFWRDAGESFLNRGFPLSSGSKVIDVGGYKGDWTDYITRRHDCYVDVYEPVYDSVVFMRARFSTNKKIKIIHAGLEEFDGKRPIALMNDSSSFYYPMREDAPFAPVCDVASAISAPVDLMAINCEGSEYNILNRLIFSGKIKSIRHILVQFHTFVHDAKARRDALQEELWKTHQQRWCYPFVWEAWSSNWRKEE
jgi:FkbM family methyltransferase